MKLLINNDYGGFGIGKEDKRKEVLSYLMGKGYSRNQAKDILEGDCPRDLPVLHEAFEKFGQWEYGALEYRELEDQPYYIENYDGIEHIRTLEEFTKPGASFEPEFAPRDWESVNVETAEGRARLLEILNSFIGEGGTEFTVASDFFCKDTETVKRVVTSFFIPKSVGVNDCAVSLWAHGLPGEEPFNILGPKTFAEASFEVLHSRKTLTVFFNQGTLGEERITIFAEQGETEL